MTGFLLGGVYALMSVGLALIFGIMKVANLAQGAFMMLGMYFTYFLYTSYGVPPLLGALLTIPPFYMLGIVVHRLLFVHVSGQAQAMEAQLMLTLGLSLIITNGVTMLLGPTPRSMVTPLATEAWHVHGLWLNQARTYAFAVALLVALGVYLFLQRTALGKALRAAADEPETALYMGIHVRRMHTIAFGLGTAITAVAGGLLATFWPIAPNVAGHFVILMCVAMVMGGLGSIPGAVVGGLLIGMVQSLSSLIVPLQLQNVGVLVALLLLLSLRPQGLFGRRGRTV